MRVLGKGVASGPLIGGGGARGRRGDGSRGGNGRNRLRWNRLLGSGGGGSLYIGEVSVDHNIRWRKKSISDLGGSSLSLKNKIERVENDVKSYATAGVAMARLTGIGKRLRPSPPPWRALMRRRSAISLY